MPNAANAVLQDQEGRSVLRFERVYRHPPERVWRALTEPGELAGWHPTPFELDPDAEGGTVRFLPEGDVPEMPDGPVSEYDPPRLLAHAWGDDQLRWELQPHDDGCLLILTHVFDDRFKAARDAAGWHVCLDALSAVLDGAGRDARELLHGQWQNLNREYEGRFGIPHDQANAPSESLSEHAPCPRTHE